MRSLLLGPRSGQQLTTRGLRVRCCLGHYYYVACMLRRSAEDAGRHWIVCESRLALPCQSLRRNNNRSSCSGLPPKEDGD